MLTNSLEHCQSLLDQCRSKRRSNHLFIRLFETQLNSIIECEFIDKFWSYFKVDFNKHDLNLHKSLLEAVEFFSESCFQIEALDDSRYKTLKDKFFETLKTQILSQKPHYLNSYLEATYIRAFKIFRTLAKARQNERHGRKLNGVERSSEEELLDEEDELEDDEEEDDDDDVKMICDSISSDNGSAMLTKRCAGCSSRDICICQSIYDKFRKMNKDLRYFELLPGLIGDTVMNVARLFIERKVSDKGKSNYSYSYLDELTIWIHDIVKRWAVEVYGLSEASEIDLVGQKLDRFLKDAYAEVRVAHMFEIIIEYPNSEAAIQDLKLCLEQSTSTSFRLNLIDSVKQSLIESLLHPGVNTYDILTAYISAIKALRALDPTGLILQLVTEPVRRYLKSRDDTVRCIVTALTDEDHNSELNREMIRSSTQTNENGIDGKSGTTEMIMPNEGEKSTQSNYDEWKPDPIKLSASDDLMKSSRFSDIVSILVNIYETKDLFVEEYQKLLSQRLLNKYYECNLDTELRNLELLTIRFSDCELHRCEVMLKDVQTSKRINKRILSGDIRDQKLDNFKNLDVLIVSSPFWPEKFSPMASLSDEPPEIKFPPEIESAMNTYTKAFEAIQASRTLHWRHHLGSVNMDLTINGKTQNFSVSPLHASLLFLFKEKKSWRLSELMHKTSLPAVTLRSRLVLWQRNGLIRDSGEDKYDLIVE